MRTTAGAALNAAEHSHPRLSKVTLCMLDRFSCGGRRIGITVTGATIPNYYLAI
jgi:hypothetical protein